MSECLAALCEGDRPVELTLLPEATPRILAERLESGYIQLRFPGPLGDTDLTLPLDVLDSDWSEADLDRGEGRLRLAGVLALDDIPVRCVAHVDLPQLRGTARLEPLI
jgi:hypothetical protein